MSSSRTFCVFMRWSGGLRFVGDRLNPRHVVEMGDSYIYGNNAFIRAELDQYSLVDWNRCMVNLSRSAKDTKLFGQLLNDPIQAGLPSLIQNWTFPASVSHVFHGHGQSVSAVWGCETQVYW